MRREAPGSMIATPTGVELIQIIHEELLKSAELTGIWEKKLREIERRTYNAGQFLEELKQMVSEVVMSVLSDNSNRHITIQAPIKENKFKKGSIITDAVGIKSYFLEEAMTIIDPEVEFVSGHPMAGREKKGYGYASKEVFKNANYILIEHPVNQKECISFMERFVGTLGFKSVKIMSPQAHDEIISFTSQLPHAIAVSLINSDNEKYETGKYIGDSYRDLTRIANINENLWSELFLRNSDYLLASIEAFEEQLDLIKVALKDNDERLLKDLFIKSSLRREKLEK